MSTPGDIPLAGLQTESLNPDSSNIDAVSTLEMCHIINAADSTVAASIRACLDDIARIIDLITARIRQGGRVVYIGAGTSGRLGVLDASEIPPTFSAPSSQFIALIAGGNSAIQHASESVEDSVTRPIADLGAISPPLGPLDTLLGIAASGCTPYVLAGLSHAHHALKLLTVGISCVKPSQMRGRCGHLVECVVGPEVVAGSTRMKAGTATKMILNMISTGVMIRAGKTHGNLMIDVKPSNHKLIDRACRIFRTVLPHTTRSDPEIDKLIKSCKGSLKLALVVEKLECSVEDAEATLDAAAGVLARAWIAPTSQTIPEVVDATEQGPPFVLCIDAGGTRCSAVIAGRSGILARGEAGPCNFATQGHDSALTSISAAVNDAVARLSQSPCPSGVPSTRPLFDAVWIGAAGLDRAADLASIKPRVAELLSLRDPAKLLLTNDAALLSSAIVVDDDTIEARIETGIVLIAGTGSIAYSFQVTSSSGSSVPTLLERTGGWGYLLGDEGSAYSIGREAIRRALGARDMGSEPTTLHKAIAEQFGCDTVGEIISAVYTPTCSPEKLQARHSRTRVVPADPKLRIASLSPLVFRAAFPEAAPDAADPEALAIIRRAAASAADTVSSLVRSLRPSASMLVMGGALAQLREYRELVLRELARRGDVFARVEAVADPAGHAVRLLIKDYLGPEASYHLR